jgi:hypothetical protein
VLAIVRRWSSLDVFYSEAGAYPIAALKRGYTWQAGPLQYVTSDAALHAVFAACLVIALAFTAGFFTHVVKWLLLPALVTVHARVWPVFAGGDAVLHSQALYALLLPVGAKFSVDSWLRQRRIDARAEPAPTALRSLAYPLLLLQLAVIYWFNSRSKTGSSWQEGRAVAESLGAVSMVSNFGAWIARLPEPLLHGMTYSTVAVETVLPFLLLSPWKRRYTHAFAAALMLALHGGIYLMLDVGAFSPAMLSYLPLLWHPTDVPTRIWSRPRWRVRVEALAVVALVYLMGARLSRDLQLWPERPQLPLAESLNTMTRVLGLLQPWMMFSPEPPKRNFVVVTDAVTDKGNHFDPWNGAAIGRATPVQDLGALRGRAHDFNSFDNYLSNGPDSPFHPFFARWVLRQRANGDPVVRFDAWMFAISTDPRQVVAAESLDQRIGVLRLPIAGALPVARLEAHGIWAPERALDGKIVPEGTHVLTPVSASMSAGCPALILDLGEAKKLHAAFFQADARDHFLIEGSLDGAAFNALGEMVPQSGRQYLSRIVALPGEPVRFVRIRPKRSGGFQNTLSEVAFFDHPVSLPTLPARPSETFFAALERPGVVGLVSGSSHPSADCPAENPNK